MNWSPARLCVLFLHEVAVLPVSWGSFTLNRKDRGVRESSSVFPRIFAIGFLWDAPLAAFSPFLSTFLRDSRTVSSVASKDIHVRGENL